jgi:hypothetical protein
LLFCFFFFGNGLDSAAILKEKEFDLYLFEVLDFLFIIFTISRIHLACRMLLKDQEIALILLHLIMIAIICNEFV